MFPRLALVSLEDSASVILTSAFIGNSFFKAENCIGQLSHVYEWNVQTQSKTGNTVNDTGRWQQGVSTAGHVLQHPGTRISPTVRQHLYHLGHNRFFIPTYLDEFKQGFPKNGLSSVSNRWWGNIASVNTQSAPESSQSSKAFPKGRELDKSQGSEVSMITEKDSTLISQMGCVLKDEKANSDSEGISMLAGNMGLHDEDLMHVSILSRTRKKSAEKGRKALKLAVTRGYSVCKLGDKDKSLLAQIFGFPLQSLWKASLSRTESVL
eukprot:Gb_00222 [translate_table: standard]